MSSPPAPIGTEQAALITGPVSIIVGTRDAALRPHLTRGAGCRLSAERRVATVLVPLAGADEVLADVRSNGRIAVVFSQPSTNRTVQLKGDDAQMLPCTDDDETLALHYLEGFVGEIGQLGFAAEVAHTILGPGQARAAIRFTVTAAFDQTPGPGAGEPLAAAGAGRP